MRRRTDLARVVHGGGPTETVADRADAGGGGVPGVERVCDEGVALRGGAQA